MKNYTEVTLEKFEGLVGTGHNLPDNEPRSSVTQQTYIANGVMLKTITHYYRKTETQYYIQDINE
tara:strand:- start:2490 stop:2684 length:195 start_codon:yes stop_codon:yes gene_type:complete